MGTAPPDDPACGASRTRWTRPPLPCPRPARPVCGARRALLLNTPRLRQGQPKGASRLPHGTAILRHRTQQPSDRSQIERHRHAAAVGGGLLIVIRAGETARMTKHQVSAALCGVSRQERSDMNSLFKMIAAGGVLAASIAPAFAETAMVDPMMITCTAYGAMDKAGMMTATMHMDMMMAMTPEEMKTAMAMTAEQKAAHMAEMEKAMMAMTAEKKATATTTAEASMMKMMEACKARPDGTVMDATKAAMQHFGRRNGRAVHSDTTRCAARLCADCPRWGPGRMFG